MENTVAARRNQTPEAQLRAELRVGKAHQRVLDADLRIAEKIRADMFTAAKIERLRGQRMARDLIT
jgi:hypothetical protein